MKAYFTRLSTWYLIGVALITGALIHIATVLVLPAVSGHAAIALVHEIAPVNDLMVLPEASPETQQLPFEAPDERLALCRYDLSKGPVSLRTALLDDTWSIALYDRRGRNFYTLTGADIKRRDIEVVLAPTEDELAGAIPLPKDSALAASIVNVSVADPQGVLVLRAPELGISREAEADRALKQASCSLRGRAQASAQ